MPDIFDELAREFQLRSWNADPYIIVKPARKRSMKGLSLLVEPIVDEWADFLKEPEAHTQE